MDGTEGRKQAGIGIVPKIGIVIALLMVVAAALWARGNRPEGRAEMAEANRPLAASPVTATAAEPPKPALPRLVDLGAGKCIPCKMMAPILDELKTEYTGKMEVVFIDIWENPDAGTEYGIQIIPTQIFYDASGNELFRHEGFMGKQEILGKWKALGVALSMVQEGGV